jgi:hypothetical protein
MIKLGLFKWLGNWLLIESCLVLSLLFSDMEVLNCSLPFVNLRLPSLVSTVVILLLDPVGRV